MTKKQKKMLVRILITAVMLIALKFIPIADTIQLLAYRRINPALVPQVLKILAHFIELPPYRSVQSFDGRHILELLCKVIMEPLDVISHQAPPQFGCHLSEHVHAERWKRFGDCMHPAKHPHP